MLKMLVLLCLIIFISGCVLQTTGGFGITVENFEPDFSSLRAGEPFKLKMKIRNAGSSPAEDINFELLNTIGNDQSSEITCNRGCGQNLDLYPADPVAGTSGESMTCIWDCEAPTGIPPGIHATYNPLLRIRYDYFSDVVTTVTFASRDELRAIQEAGDPIPADVKTTTNAPVAVDIVFKGPIKYWENQGTVSFPVEISLNNVGGGVACYPDCEDKEDWNKVKIEAILDSGIKLEECEFMGTKEVLLWEGKSRTVRCQAEYSGLLGTEFSGLEVKTFDLTVEYNYMVEAGTSVTITG